MENLEDRWKVNFPLVSQDFPLVSQNFPWVSHVLSMGLPSSQKLPEAENLFWQVAEWFCGSIEQGANRKKYMPATKELWSKITFFKWAWQTLKVLPCLWTLYLLNVRHWSFPMRYCMTLYLKGLQNYRPSKFEQLDFSPFTIQIRPFSRL